MYVVCDYIHTHTTQLGTFIQVELCRVPRVTVRHDHYQQALVSQVVWWTHDMQTSFFICVRPGRIHARNAYQELLQERSAHGATQEVQVEALILRLRYSYVLTIMFSSSNLIKRSSGLKSCSSQKQSTGCVQTTANCITSCIVSAQTQRSGRNGAGSGFKRPWDCRVWRNKQQVFWHHGPLLWRKPWWYYRKVLHKLEGIKCLLVTSSLCHTSYLSESRSNMHEAFRI